jgi:hypothetical protein
MTDPRPAPLVPPEVDLRDFGFMPLEGDRLRKSRTWLRAATDPWVAYACINLWIEAWHQVPAGSLPGDRVAVGRMSGSTPKVWRRIADQVLDGWIGPCTDGRYYHPVVCEKALDAWERQRKQRQRTKAATDAAAERRRQERRTSVTDDSRMDVTDNVTDQRNHPLRNPRDRDRDSKGKEDSLFPSGEEGETHSSPLRGEAKESVTDVSHETQVYRRGKEILGDNTAALIKKLVNATNGDWAEALTIIEMAAKKENPREYIGGAIVKRKPTSKMDEGYGDWAL